MVNVSRFRKLLFIFPLLLCSVSLMGCSSGFQTIMPSPPDLSLFIKAGCVQKEYVLDCSAIGLEKKYSCAKIGYPSSYAGSLTPKVSMAECRVNGDYRDSTVKGVYAVGCRMRTYIRYIVSTSDGFKLLANKEEFSRFFIPIETPEEALGFLESITGNEFWDKTYLKKNMDVKKGPYVEIFAPDVKPSFVEQTKEGFEVRLFKRDLCGCEHPVFAIDYLVTRDAKVIELARLKIIEFKGPCVD